MITVHFNLIIFAVIDLVVMSIESNTKVPVDLNSST